MNFEITIINDDDGGLDSIYDYLEGQDACADVERVKRDQSAQSAYDTVAFAVQVGSAIGVVAAGIKVFLSRLGDRARITVRRKGGSVIAVNVSSKDAARIAEAMLKE